MLQCIICVCMCVCVCLPFVASSTLMLLRIYHSHHFYVFSFSINLKWLTNGSGILHPPLSASYYFIRKKNSARPHLVDIRMWALCGRCGVSVFETTESRSDRNKFVLSTYSTYTVLLMPNKFYRFVWSMWPWEKITPTICMPPSLAIWPPCEWLWFLLQLNSTCVFCLFRYSKCYWN